MPPVEMQAGAFLAREGASASHTACLMSSNVRWIEGRFVPNIRPRLARRLPTAPTATSTGSCCLLSSCRLLGVVSAPWKGTQLARGAHSAHLAGLCIYFGGQI